MVALLFVLFFASSPTGGLNAPPLESDQPGAESLGSELQGSVVDGQGHPVPFASLTLQRSDFSRMVIADQNGNFHFVGVPNGRYRIEAKADGFGSGSEQVDTEQAGSQLRMILSLMSKDDTDQTSGAGDLVVTAKTLGAPAKARKEYEKGLELLSRGQYEAALERFDAALGKHPEFPAARASRGQTLLRLGRVEAAYEDFGEALRLDPAAYDANLGMGMSCNDLGRYAESEGYLLRALAAQPGQWAPELELGRAYYGLRRYAEAEQHSQRP